MVYTGVTNDLERRCYEHKMKLVEGFPKKYNVDKLVYFEIFELKDIAIVIEDANYNDHEEKIKEAAESCPVEVIRFIG